MLEKRDLPFVHMGVQVVRGISTFPKPTHNYLQNCHETLPRLSEHHK